LVTALRFGASGAPDSFSFWTRTPYPVTDYQLTVLAPNRLHSCGFPLGEPPPGV